MASTESTMMKTSQGRGEKQPLSSSISRNRARVTRAEST